MWLALLIFYLVVLSAAKISGLIHYRSMDIGSRIIVIYIAEVWLCETLAFFTAMVYRDNRLVYHVFSVVQFLLVCWYFHHSLALFKRYPIALIAGFIGVVFGLINGIYLQPNKVNSNFLLFESIAVITMTLVSLYEMLATDDDIDLAKHPQFWFTCLLFIFWSFTFTYWLIQVIDPLIRKLPWVGYAVTFVNILCYTGFGLVFLTFRKKKLA